jgi:hypothetical protein
MRQVPPRRRSVSALGGKAGHNLHTYGVKSTAHDAYPREPRSPSSLAAAPNTRQTLHIFSLPSLHLRFALSGPQPCSHRLALATSTNCNFAGCSSQFACKHSLARLRSCEDRDWLIAPSRKVLPRWKHPAARPQRWRTSSVQFTQLVRSGRENAAHSRRARGRGSRAGRAPCAKPSQGPRAPSALPGRSPQPTR